MFLSPFSTADSTTLSTPGIQDYAKKPPTSKVCNRETPSLLDVLGLDLPLPQTAWLHQALQPNPPAHGLTPTAAKPSKNAVTRSGPRLQTATRMKSKWVSQALAPAEVYPHHFYSWHRSVSLSQLSALLFWRYPCRHDYVGVEQKLRAETSLLIDQTWL